MVRSFPTHLKARFNRSILPGNAAARVIELSARSDDDAEATIVAVRDHGPGFSPDVLPHVFEPFFTTKGPDQGKGLGLSIVHTTMNSFAEHASARNHRSSGAEVTLTFPQTGAREEFSSPFASQESLNG